MIAGNLAQGLELAGQEGTLHVAHGGWFYPVTAVTVEDGLIILHTGAENGVTSGEGDRLGVCTIHSMTTNNPTPTPVPFTALEFADRLEALMRPELETEARYSGCRSWEDLHEVCDPNEWIGLVEVDLDGIGFPDTEDETEWQAQISVYHSVINEAMNIVAHRLWG